MLGINLCNLLKKIRTGTEIKSFLSKVLYYVDDFKQQTHYEVSTTKSKEFLDV